MEISNFIKLLQINKRTVLRKVYYRINVPYYDAALYDHSADIQDKQRAAVAAYYCEIVNLLISDGWTLDENCLHPSYSGCPELRKGYQRLYCHPQSISGCIMPDDTERLGNVLLDANTFMLYKRDEYEYVVAVKDAQDETALYHEIYDNGIFWKLKERLTTKRRNLYCKDFSALWKMYSEDIAIRTTLTDGVLSSDNAGFRYLMEKYEQAKRAGLIIVPQDGLCRWITDKESCNPQADVIKVNSANTFTTNKHLTTLYKRDENKFMVVRNTDYINGFGYLTGTPVLTVSNGEYENVDPSNLFHMIYGSNSFTDMLTGNIDWETREAWLSHFTDAEKRLAVTIEYNLKDAA